MTEDEYSRKKVLLIIGLFYLLKVGFSLEDTTKVEIQGVPNLTQDANSLVSSQYHHELPPTNIVEIESGPVEGYLQDGDLGTKFYSFRGVPYSKQPVGDLRFAPLQPADKWTEVYDAVKEAPICIQHRKILSPVYLQNQTMSEACLGVNIHVPAKRKHDGPLPVLVFMYGGAFNFFSSDPDFYGPEFLVAKDVVVVTFNFRHNIFGFLSLNTPEAPGNLGIKDALFLLNWVQRNIAAFNGNPEEVTLGGFSAGASIAQTLMMQPAADGIFKRVIMHSGNALAPFMAVYPGYQAQLLAALKGLLNISTDDTAEVFKILKTVDFEVLRNVTDSLIDIFGIISFAPVIEQRFDGNQAVISDYPYSELIANKSVDIPQLIGFTKDEGATLEYRLKYLDLLNVLKKDPTKLIPLDIAFTSDTNKIPALIEQFLSRYFADGSIDIEDVLEYERLIAESFFIYPTLRYAKYNAENKQQPTYMYEFKFNGDNNLVTRKISQAKVKSAGHGDDLNYIFKPNFYDTRLTLRPNSKEELTKNRMVEMWTNFIKTGNPTPTTNELIEVQWPPVDAEELKYLEIDAELSIKINPHPDVIEFNDQFYPLPVNKKLA